MNLHNIFKNWIISLSKRRLWSQEPCAILLGCPASPATLFPRLLPAPHPRHLCALRCTPSLKALVRYHPTAKRCRTSLPLASGKVLFLPPPPVLAAPFFHAPSYTPFFSLHHYISSIVLTFIPYGWPLVLPFFNPFFLSIRVLSMLEFSLLSQDSMPPIFVLPLLGWASFPLSGSPRRLQVLLQPRSQTTLPRCKLKRSFTQRKKSMKVLLMQVRLKPIYQRR